MAGIRFVTVIHRSRSRLCVCRASDATRIRIPHRDQGYSCASQPNVFFAAVCWYMISSKNAASPAKAYTHSREIWRRHQTAAVSGEPPRPKNTTRSLTALVNVVMRESVRRRSHPARRAALPSDRRGSRAAREVVRPAMLRRSACRRRARRCSAGFCASTAVSSRARRLAWALRYQRVRRARWPAA